MYLLTLSKDNEFKLLEVPKNTVRYYKTITDATPSIFMALFFEDGTLASSIDPKLYDSLYKNAKEAGLKVSAFAGEHATPEVNNGRQG